MKTLLFLLMLGACLPLFSQIPEKDLSPEMSLEKQPKGHQSASPEFWISDLYNDVQFVKFTRVTHQKRSAVREILYTSDDSRYKGWTIKGNVNNKSIMQWQVQPPISLRAPNGGPVNYCVTIDATCDGHDYIVSCYSTCDGKECGDSFKEFKGFNSCSWSW